MQIIDAIILGIVEGLTEFLPVSSTGHLILASSFLGLSQDDFLKSFEVVIQLGSILAILFIFWQRLFRHSFLLWGKLCIGFLPAGVLGYLLYPIIKSLFNPLIVVVMLVLGGIVFIVIEYFYKEREHKITDVSGIGIKQVIIIGFCQALAMIPGTSRSGATIIGGLLLGCDRKTAAEFSFLLALPTMVVAGGYSIYKNMAIFHSEHLTLLGVGFVVAFLSAVVAIKLFLGFISRFSFVPFGIYRIVLGVVLLSAYSYFNIDLK